jgi:tRNA(Ile)-lysidine synthase
VSRLKTTRLATRSARVRRAGSGEALPASVLAFCRRHAVFQHGESVVAAVSGGPDSISLLHCLHQLARELGISLHVAHVHHGLREADADADAAYVQQEAHSLVLPYTLLRTDVRAFAASERLSLESAARTVRYAGLRSLAKDLGADCLALGHTEDDQAETVLLHLLRGSGLDGLAAMRPRRGDLARPLLGQPRAAITAFCAAQGLSPRDDRTNDDPTIRRNAVRWELLPALETFNPRARTALARCAGTLAADADYLRAQAEEALVAVLAPCDIPQGTALSLESLSALPLALRNRVLRLVVERLWGEGSALFAGRLEELEALARQEIPGHGIDIGKGYRAERMETCLIIRPYRVPAPPLEPVTLPIPGVVMFCPWRIEATVIPVNEARASLGNPATPGTAVASCDRDVLSDMVVVRGRRPGDRLRPLGLQGSKKVQDILVDRKIPQEERDLLPVLTNRSGIVWLVDLALDSSVAITGETREAIRLVATRVEPGSNQGLNAV